MIVLIHFREFWWYISSERRGNTAVASDERITLLENKVEALKSEVDKLQSELKSVQEAKSTELAADAVIFGVPYVERENLKII